ncbi:MAG TPA: ROK family protein [Devosiaceae bacterium]|nr:ROK family protein [Devosiaceae bacterium]
MARGVAAADLVRRQNRSLVLATLRRDGPMSRTRLASTTGLSHASISAIGNELINQHVLVDEGEVAEPGARGRPAVRVSFNRRACHAIIVELDVNQARFSLVDYAGTLVDRIERSVTPTLFHETRPAVFLREQLDRLRQRNPEAEGTLRRIAISAQGILDPTGDRLKWSPIAHIAGESIVAPLRAALGCEVTLTKRGRLLAEGARLLYPELRDLSIATIFIGSTVAMGMSLPGRVNALGEGGATEFGHMNHLPDGARCRCGMRGCIEAYAADYAVLRTAYGVPDQAPPAAAVPPAAFQELVRLGQSGRRNVVHAFNVAGRAIGYGLARVMTISPPHHVIIIGPGASAFDLMRAEIEAALGTSLVCRINSPPPITVHHDEREPIFQGMLLATLSELDQSYFAGLGAGTRL